MPPRLTREQISERLQTIGTALTTVNQGLFSGGAAVPSGKIRFVVAIFIIGDMTTTRNVTFQKLAANGTTYTTIFPSVPIAPPDVRQLPPSNYDIENPIATFEDNTNLVAASNAGAPYAVVVYWDNER
jgi:hypothetical protein